MNTATLPTEEQRAEQPIRYVLFVCNHNAGRSQMAQAFFERYGPEDVRAESAGTEPAPEIWPPVVEAMREVGLTSPGASQRSSRSRCSCTPIGRSRWAAAMPAPTCRRSWRRGTYPTRPADRSRRSRAIRDGIQAQIRELIAVRLEAIRADRTAHEFASGRLLPMLAEEFGRHPLPGGDTRVRRCGP